MAADKRKEDSFRKLYVILTAAAVLVACICFVRGILVLGKVRTDAPASQSTTAVSEFNAGWFQEKEDGSRIPVTLPCEIPAPAGGTITLVHSLGEDQAGQVLFFDNNRQGVIVSADTAELYRVNNSPLVRQILFTDYQMVTLPSDGSAAELRMTFSMPAGENGSFELPEVLIGCSEGFIWKILSKEMLTIFILFTLLIVGLAMLVFTVFLHINRYQDVRLYHLYLFMLFVIIWGATDSYLPVLTRIPQEIIGMASYFSLMAIPLPISMFVNKSLHNKYTALKVLANLSAVNLILEGILSMLGVISLHRTFFTAHLLILLIIGAGIISFMREMKQQPVNRALRILFAGILELAATASVSMALYWFKGGAAYRNCLLIGLLLFVVILLASITARFMVKLRKRQTEETEMKMLERFEASGMIVGTHAA